MYVAVQQTERIRTMIKSLIEQYTAWRKERDAVRELNRFSDRELADIGIIRCDIELVVRGTSAL